MKNRQHRVLAGIIGMAISVGAGAFLMGSTIYYTYDPAGRLIGADYGSGKSISYAYDPAGNLVQMSQGGPGLIVDLTQRGQLTLSWPAAPTGFVLESSPVLGPGAVWTSAGVAPVLNGNQFIVTIPVDPTTKFYRLRK